MKKLLPILLVISLIFASCTAMGNLGEDASDESKTTNNESTIESTTAPEPTEIRDVGANLSKDKVIWGPGKTTEHQQPSEPLRLNELYSQYDAMFLNGNEKQVLLTFDEGYENGFTPSILDTLKQKKVKAIFFVTYDFAKGNPELIRRMIDEGHIVGNHTYRHKTMDEIGIETATEEVTVLHDYIKENFNYTMKYFRFPKGEFSESSLSLVKELGYKSIFWSFAYADWDAKTAPDKTQAFEKITSSTHNGAIFLLHAVSATNAEILGSVIDNVREQGYEFTIIES